MQVFDTESKMKQVFKENKTIMVSVSGGSDSDILIDLFERKKKDNEIIYVFFNTGLEFNATLNHLKYLEEKYKIKIIRRKAVKTIPQTKREYGVPFKSKQTSEFLMRLQKHDFDFKDIEFGHAYCMNKYPKTKGALDWLFGVNRTMNCPKYLRAYLLENGLKIKVQNKCCQYAKKDVSKVFLKENKHIDCVVTGMRVAEGGQRFVIKDCYKTHTNGIKYYNPLLHWSDETKSAYKEYYKIKNSDCYEVYGLKRTGCAACPFGQNTEEELKVIEKYEPNLFKAVNNVFGDAYKLKKDIDAFRELKRYNNQTKLF